MQPSDVCRICGGKGLLLQITDPETKCTEDIEDCLSVKLKPDDGLSQVICHKCLGTVSLCKPFVAKINLVKDNNSAPSSKKCYTCLSTKGHLFPFPDTSAQKLEEFFGLSVVKPKTSKICHECQYYLDCVSDLREKANKVPHRGQNSKFVVKQGLSSVDDFVCSLKDRKVEDDGSSHSRKTSRTPRSSHIKSKGKEDSNNIGAEEGLTPKRRGAAKNKKSAEESDDSHEEMGNAKKKSNRRSVRENNVSNNESSISGTKESGLKRRRQLSRSSDSDINTSIESVSEKSKKLVGKNVSHDELRRSSRDSNDSKQNEPSKKSMKSKDSKETAESKLSSRTKRQKVDKHDKESEVGSDSGNDMILASVTIRDVKDEKLDESLKRLGRSKSVKTAVVKVVDLNNAKKKPQGKSSRNPEADQKHQVYHYLKNESENSRLPRRVHFESHKESVRRKHVDQSRKRTAVAIEESSDEGNEPLVKSRKNPPLKAYTCSVCSDDFRSTVEGKEHELKHDERFNKFEIKLVRVLKSDVLNAEKNELSKNDDENDDLWNIRSDPKQPEKAIKEDAFDALFDSEAAVRKSSPTNDSDLRDVAESGSKTFHNSSYSETEDVENNASKSEKPEGSSETNKIGEETESSEIGKTGEVSKSKLSEEDKPTVQEDSSEVEKKDEVSEKENLDSEGKLESEEKLNSNDKSDSEEKLVSEEKLSSEEKVDSEEKLDSEEQDGKPNADDSGSLNSTVFETRNGDCEEEEEKLKEVDNSKEEENPDDAEENVTSAEAVPEENISSMNGTDVADDVISSQEKNEVNATIEDESSPVQKKSECVESPQSDRGSSESSIKETVSEDTHQAD